MFGEGLGLADVFAHCGGLRCRCDVMVYISTGFRAVSLVYTRGDCLRNGGGYLSLESALVVGVEKMCVYFL